jgi:phosphohistidine phosphatase
MVTAPVCARRDAGRVDRERRCQTRPVPPRRLVLVRHAQAGNAPVDADRPLTPQGERRAAEIGAWLARTDVVPDLVLVSSARRAVQTWELAGALLTPVPHSVVDERIYENTVDDLLAAIGEAPEEVRTVAVVGHNPSVGVLAAELDGGEGDPDARSGLQDGFPAGGVAVFDLAVPFAGLSSGAATLRAFDVPAD